MPDQNCNCRPRWEGHECTVFTPAEQALSDSVHGDNEVTVLYDRDVKDAIADVRGPLYEEVAQRLLAHAQDAEDNDATEDAVYTFMVAANQVREWAALRSTEKGNTDDR